MYGWLFEAMGESSASVAVSFDAGRRLVASDSNNTSMWFEMALLSVNMGRIRYA